MNIDVLIVEDGFLTASFIKNVLQEQGIKRVDIVDNSVDAQRVFHQNPYDLIFMDINIKGKVDGLDLAEYFYQKYHTKIIFITSYQDSKTIEKAALSEPIGYLVKPVIQADIESILMISKRFFQHKQEKIEILHFSKYSYDTTAKVLVEGKTQIKLSKLEAKALELLLENKNATVNNEILKEHLWSISKEDTALRELIFRLRKKIPKVDIKNQSNLGYILLD